jgi:ribonuclease VapC
VTALVVDTSAAVAILTSEPEAEKMIERLSSATSRLMSTATLLELSIVMEARLGPAGQGVVERFVRDSEIELIAVDRSHVDRALEGWRRFGKGRHKAALNFGDCFSYALSVASGHPLLYVGEDFPLTDLPRTDEEPS